MIFLTERDLAEFLVELGNHIKERGGEVKQALVIMVDHEDNMWARHLLKNSDPFFLTGLIEATKSALVGPKPVGMTQEEYEEGEEDDDDEYEDGVPED
jgi:hypothetical protein